MYRNIEAAESEDISHQSGRKKRTSCGFTDLVFTVLVSASMYVIVYICARNGISNQCPTVHHPLSILSGRGKQAIQGGGILAANEEGGMERRERK